MDKGIYCLVFRNPACTVRVGALGPLTFRAGWHIYIGSALGSGGLSRVERHIALAAARDKTPKWHVDYLLTSLCFTLTFAVSAPTLDRLECTLAYAIGGDEVRGFGCSDCSCSTHLFSRTGNPRNESLAAFRQCGLVPSIKSIKNPEVEKTPS